MLAFFALMMLPLSHLTKTQLMIIRMPKNKQENNFSWYYFLIYNNFFTQNDKQKIDKSQQIKMEQGYFSQEKRPEAEFRTFFDQLGCFKGLPAKAAYLRSTLRL